MRLLHLFIRASGLALVVVLGVLLSWPGAVQAQSTAAVVGSVAGNTNATLSGQPILPNTTIYSGDSLQVQNGVAIVAMNNGGRITFGHNTTVSFLRDSEETTVVMDGDQGGAILYHPAESETVQIKAGDVYVSAASGFLTEGEVATADGSVVVSSREGTLRVHANGREMEVGKGKTMKLSARRAMTAGSPQGTGPVINAIMPAATVQKSGQTQQTNLTLGDLLNGGDLVRTLKLGRVRIAMPDGSFLNVGARSQMQIPIYDPALQQTQVALTLGRMRAEVVKLKVGGSFEIRTQTAVIGVVGTIVSVWATPKNTQVWCIEGACTVRNINPAFANQVTLHAGQSSNVPSGGGPTGPVTASASQIEAETNLTKIGPGMPVAANPSVALVGGASALNAATVAVGGVGAILGGFAVSRADSATNAANAAASNANAASSTAAAAGVAAGNAANVANSVGCALNTFNHSVNPTSASPYTPGNGFTCSPGGGSLSISGGHR